MWFAWRQSLSLYLLEKKKKHVLTHLMKKKRNRISYITSQFEQKRNFFFVEQPTFSNIYNWIFFFCFNISQVVFRYCVCVYCDITHFQIFFCHITWNPERERANIKRHGFNRIRFFNFSLLELPLLSLSLFSQIPVRY